LQQGVDDPLTLADITSHVTLMSHLKPLFPAIDIISEEHDARKLPAPEAVIDQQYLDSQLPVSGMVKPEDVQVWLDPLDATKEFSEGLTNYVTVLACIAVKGTPVAGVVHYPFENKTLWAWKGRGMSFRPTEKPVPGDPLRVIVSRSHAGDIRTNAPALGVSKDGVTPAGGAGYKVGEVLAGQQDAYLHKTRIKKWDLCAGHALLNAAGGRMTDWRGRDIDYSDGTEPYVRGGIVATMYGHTKLINKLGQLDLDAMEAANGVK